MAFVATFCSETIEIVSQVNGVENEPISATTALKNGTR
jgi:hypothetical protein